MSGRGWFRRMMAVGVALLVTWAAAALTRVPVELHGEDEALIRLSWRLDGAVVRQCRPPTERERDRMPAHMTREEICEEQIVPYRLSVRLGDRDVLEREVGPRGARGDRPLSVFQEISVAPGEHPLRVRFVPDGPVGGTSAEDTAGPDLPRLALDTLLSLEGRQVALVTYDREAGRLLVRTQERR